MTAVIETEKLTKSYGDHRGIIDVDLAVEQGEIFGFLGPNGAGKTTTIRTLLDLIRPTSGRALVFGIESSADPVAIHRRVGYLPGEFTLYDRLTGGQTLEYFANLRGGVDPAYQALAHRALRARPEPPLPRVQQGQQAEGRASIIALQHRPELLILDEPTSGLDPLVQQTFFVDPARDRGRRRDRLPLEPHPLRGREELRPRGDHPRRPPRQGRHASTRCATSPTTRSSSGSRGRSRPPSSRRCPGVSEVVADDHVLRMRVAGAITPVVQAAARYELLDFVSREPSLEETFLAQYGREAGEVNDDGR